MTNARDISLGVAIILWATILGGVAYSHIVFFPPYLSALPQSASLVHGPYGLHDERFWLMIHPLLILSLIVTFALHWRVKPRRNRIAISMGIYAVAIVATAIYFVPELIAFAKSPESNVTAAEWYARGQTWQHLSWLRGVFMYAGFIPLLLAFRRPAAVSA